MRKYFFLQKLIAYSLIVPSFALADELKRDFSQYYSSGINEPGAILITPPKGWQAADPALLPPKVKFMVVGKGKGTYPPSINLGTEPYKGTTKDYLKMVKQVNESLGAECKDLGKIKTKSGSASLSQVDMNTEWGPVRMLHVVLVKNRTVYVITAGALKNEFHHYYKDFFDTIKSIRFNPDIFELVADSQKRRNLEQRYDRLIEQHESIKKRMNKEASNLAVFESADFQLNCWQPFMQIIEQDYKDLGESWKEQAMQKFRNDLVAEFE
jgi:hypothetical protein